MGWSDLTSLVQGGGLAVMGEDVLYTPGDGSGAFTVRAHVYMEGVAVDLDLEIADVQDFNPEVHVRAVPDPPLGIGGRVPESGDTITARGKVLEVRTSDPDGEGVLAIKCHEADAP